MYRHLLLEEDNSVNGRKLIYLVPQAGNEIHMYLNHISYKITEYLVNVVPYKSSNAGNT